MFGLGPRPVWRPDGITPTDHEMGGSGPAKYESDAHVAQSAEHFLGKEEVSGSNPDVGSSTPF